MITNNLILTLLNVLINLLDVLLVILPILLSVAFMTIIERKQLAAHQRRVGPNTTGYYGLLQPFSDALKLIVKETVIPSQSNKILFYLAPVFPIFIFYFISILAETSRTPFDLQEAESELVAGFFTEHSSVPFVFFFLAEYASIVLFSCITSILFLYDLEPLYLE